MLALLAWSGQFGLTEPLATQPGQRRASSDQPLDAAQEGYGGRWAGAQLARRLRTPASGSHAPERARAGGRAVSSTSWSRASPWRRRTGRQGARSRLRWSRWWS